MSLDASRARARELAEQLHGQSSVPSEVLRAEAVAFCIKAPEPPLYWRKEDPVRVLARKLIPEGEQLLGRAMAVGDSAWVAALDAWLVALHAMSDGPLEVAEASWRKAQQLERLASESRRLFVLSDERLPPVFDASTRQSRFDPRPERTVRVKLPCPSCRRVGDFTFSSRVSLQNHRCPLCAQPFDAYCAEVRSVEVVRLGPSRRRYVFRLSELVGSATRIEVEDSSVGALTVARNDFLAFLYQPRSIIRGVVNLTSSHVLWVTSPGPCFVATVAFGADAPELQVLRWFRDERLMLSGLGRAFVWAYYRVGPTLAAIVSARPVLTGWTKRVLKRFVRELERAR
jgi:hypothetical protein